MPFKWRLKKTRKYDLSTKNLFIVGVYQLDNSYLECTLNSESTGEECLTSIAQRMELSESYFFGLRYVTKKLHFHWVDLEKPLKKQLDKYAQPANHCHCLYFGVMFYVIGAHKIVDEVARYHYYLQLKNDIIDGRLPCSTDQAIRLAAYSLQAEFGDYEPDRYAAEDYLLFPKTMMKDEAISAELFSEAVAGHASLQGVPPIRAELQYVKEVQVMDGYGAEYYTAKDESRKDLYMATSYAGISARYLDGHTTVCYKWSEIAKVTQNKKTLEVDTSKSSVQFQLEDTDTAKYVCRLAQLQCKFYKSSKANLSNSLTDLSLSEENEGGAFMDAQQVYIPPTDYSSHSSQELAHSQTSLTHSHEQRQSLDPAGGSHQSSLQSLESSTESKQQQQQTHHQLQQQQHQQQQQIYTVDRPLPVPTLAQQQHHPQDGGDHMFHPALSQHPHLPGNEPEVQQPDVTGRFDNSTPTPDGDPVYVNRAALLPAYRPSPDYETLMQQRIIMQQQQTTSQSNQHFSHHHQQQPQPHFDEVASAHLGAAQVYVHSDGMAYSQPEISHGTLAYRSNSFNLGSRTATHYRSSNGNVNVISNDDEHGNYANVDALKSFSIYANVFNEGPSLQHFGLGGRSGSVSGGEGGGGFPVGVHPTYSSPDLHMGFGGHNREAGFITLANSSSMLTDHQFLSDFEAAAYHSAHHHQYENQNLRLPPPYPRTSSSTPDLASTTNSLIPVAQPSVTGPGSLYHQQQDLVLQAHSMEVPDEEHLIGHTNSNNLMLGHSMDDLSTLQTLQHTTVNLAGSDSPTVALPRPAMNSESVQEQHPPQSLQELPPMLSNMIKSSLEEIAPPSSTEVDMQRRPSVASAQNSSTHSSLQGAHRHFAHAKLDSATNKVLSDDPDDTSSDHSYSTFHAKESDESSDDENVHPKVLMGPPQPAEEPKIQIRMFSAEEAPPPSKIKEEAILRESFRRLKIARTGSLGKDAPSVLKRSSLRGLKELGGVATFMNQPPLNVVSEQDSTDSLPQGHSKPSRSHTDPSASQHGKLDNEMKEIIDRLGDPPPYSGPHFLETGSGGVIEQAFDSSNSNSKQIQDLDETDSAPPPESNTVSTVPAPDPTSTNKEMPNGIPTTKVKVKRSSSAGNPSSASLFTNNNNNHTDNKNSNDSNAPPLPVPRREPLGTKHRAATFNLDTVVPISKPGMVRFMKDGSASNMSTSVLRSEVRRAASSAGTTSARRSNDSESLRSSGTQDDVVNSAADGENVDNRSSLSTEDRNSLYNNSVSSDSDSDYEKSPSDGLNVGPLKMAAMNGLTLSRSVVLSLMNDESRAPKDDRRRMLESKISEGQVYAEFQQIPRKSNTLECQVAKAAHNASKNRFKDVLPYDATRVKLSPRKDNPDGYINASNVKLTANEYKWSFIATQAPLEHTVLDFWQMVWENGVHVLAMLTPFQESGKSKCFMYWPQEVGPQHKQVYGQFEVELQFTDDSLCYLTSRIILRHNGKQHLVWHLQYTDWPDHGCPDDTYGFLGFLDEVESVARLAENESEQSQKSPVIIHCSAGVGRTGVVILTMVMKWCLEHNHNVDLPKALSGIRNQRMHMVQTMGQYRFIHDTLIQYLKNTRLI